MDNARTLLLRACERFSEEERGKIERASVLAEKAHEGQVRRMDKSPYIVHPIAVARILCEWGADADTVVSGLLHDAVEDTSLRLREIEREFGRGVASLVQGVTKFTQVDFEGLEEQESLDQEIETFRRLFEVMRRDIRVVIIKMADRLDNLRTIEGLPEERRVSFAKESIDVYYKLAYHLGMNEVCREFMNLCIPHVYPEKAKIRERHWKERRGGVEKAVHTIERQLRDEMGADMIQEVILVKSSHDLPRPNNEDESADRAYYCVLIVRDTDACYNTFKVLHKLYHPVRRKFHDYIASPPESGYRSLHTTIIGPHDKPMQIRIRTATMDEQVQWGVLLTAFGDQERDEKIFSWLQRSADIDQTTRESSEAFWQALQSDIFQKSMQVTVNGKTVSVPLGSSALDAAYVPLLEDAHRTVRVTVNGQERDLATVLSEDDVVEVTLGKKSCARFEWLQYVKTKFARNQIVEALKDVDRSERFVLGQELLQKELDHFQKKLVGEITRQERDAVVKHFRRNSFEEVIVMVGEGVIRPQEVVFAMQGEGRSLEEKVFHFRLQLLASHDNRDEVVSQISALGRLNDVTIENIAIPRSLKPRVISIQLRGISKDRNSYADFLAALERHSWISKLRTLLSLKQRLLLASLFSVAFLVVIGDVFLLTYSKDWLVSLPVSSIALLGLTVLTPPCIANFYLLRMLRDYVVWLRNDRWFFGLSFALNVLTCALILYQGILIGLVQSILPLLAIFTFFMFYIGYRFIVTEQIFEKASREVLHPLSNEQWQRLKKKKIAGYLMRLGAVTIWGIQPLYLRYTPANEVDPFVRIFLTGVGVLCITGIFMGIRRLISGNVGTRPYRLPRNILLFNIIVGYILFTYFLNASLQFTTSTNFILFNNFSPVIALLVGAIVWRSSIPYLKEPQKMLWIFLIFLMGSTGSAMIIFNSLQGAGAGSVYGDFLGLMAMVADTLLVVSQIRYLKLFDKVSSLWINMYVFVAHVLTVIPLLLWYYITGDARLETLAIVPVLYGVGAGVMAGIGQILNYETFRRIDGFIAFLMFNISILITFVIEVFFLGGFAPTWTLFIGGFIIMTSTILAEIINSHCQRKGL